MVREVHLIAAQILAQPNRDTRKNTIQRLKMNDHETYKKVVVEMKNLRDLAMIS